MRYPLVQTALKAKSRRQTSIPSRHRQHGGNSELRATSRSLHLFDRAKVLRIPTGSHPRKLLHFITVLHPSDDNWGNNGFSNTHCTFALRRRKRGGPCAMQGENKALVRIRIRPHSLSSGQSISVTFMFSTRWTASLGGHHIVQPRRYYTRYRVNYVRCFTM